MPPKRRTPAGQRVRVAVAQIEQQDQPPTASSYRRIAPKPARPGGLQSSFGGYYNTNPIFVARKRNVVDLTKTASVSPPAKRAKVANAEGTSTLGGSISKKKPFMSAVGPPGRPLRSPFYGGIRYNLTPLPLDKDLQNHPVYHVVSHNPRLCLAIIHIAERNLQHVNFASALNHIPNADPTLPPASPIEGWKWMGDMDLHVNTSEHDQTINFLFWPKFYRDGRHAIGYYTAQDYRVENGFVVEAENLADMLFTPCEDQDLDKYGLRSWRRLEVEVIAPGGGYIYKGGPDHPPAWRAWNDLWDVIGKEWDTQLGLLTGRFNEEALLKMKGKAQGRMVA